MLHDKQQRRPLADIWIGAIDLTMKQKQKTQISSGLAQYESVLLNGMLLTPNAKHVQLGRLAPKEISNRTWLATGQLGSPR